MPAEKKILYAMQSLILIFAFGYITAVTFMAMPDTGSEHSKTIVGFVLGTLVTTLVNRNWGTSRGSEDKTEAAEKRLDAATIPSPITQIDQDAIDAAKTTAAEKVEEGNAK